MRTKQRFKRKRSREKLLQGSSILNLKNEEVIVLIWFQGQTSLLANKLIELSQMDTTIYTQIFLKNQ